MMIDSKWVVNLVTDLNEVRSLLFLGKNDKAMHYVNGILAEMAVFLVHKLDFTVENDDEA